MAQLGKLVLDMDPTKTNPRNSEGAFLQSKNNGLLFAYSRYNSASWHDDAACDIALIRSFDAGETWSQEEVIVKASRFGVDNIMSVSGLKLKDGRLSFIFLIKKPDGTIDFGITYSTDDGRTFTQTMECKRSYVPSYYVMNNDRVERLSDGRVIFPVAYHRMAVATSDNDFHEFERFCVTRFLVLDENEISLSALPPRIVLDELAYSKTGVQEPGMVELKNGSIWVYCRTDRHAQYESFSVDGLRTCTPVRQSPFTSPPSPMKIKRDPYTGTLYSVWNPVPNYNTRKLTAEGWGRTPFVIAKSIDEGITWSEPKELENDEKRGYCYPALHFTEDESLIIAYCRGGEGDNACLNRLGIRKIKKDEI